MSDEATLLGFGFPEERVKAALSATNNGGLDAALNWLEAHPNDSGISENSSNDETSQKAPEAAPEEAAPKEAAPEAQSIKCNECGKLFQNEVYAQAHAEKSRHTDFAQSTEAIKPLTEEEKKQELEKLQKKLKEKRAKAEEDEKKRQRENEIIRRKAGKDLSENQERLKEQQMKRDLAEQQRIKREDQEAARRIKLQIEQDRKDRAARIAQEKAERENAGSANVTAGNNNSIPSMINAGLPKVSTEGSTQARLQIRPMLQSDSAPAKPLTHTFSADQTLKDVFKFVKEQIPHLGRHIKLSTTFPRKDFSTHHESKTLKELGLVPNAALILTE